MHDDPPEQGLIPSHSSMSTPIMTEQRTTWKVCDGTVVSRYYAPPPILYTTSRLKWGGGGGGGGGLIFEDAISLDYKPPPPPPPMKSMPFTISTNYGDDFQDREYCSRTSRLQSCVVSLHRRRAASSTRGQ